MTAPAIRTGTSRGDGETLDTRLKREIGSLTASSTQVGVFAALAATGVCLAVGAFVLADGRWMSLPRAVPFIVVLAAIAPLAVAARVMTRMHGRLFSLQPFAHRVEQEQALRAGSLSGALQVSGDGVLGARAAQDVARRLPSGNLAPAFGQQLKRRQWSALAAAVVCVPGFLFLAGRFANDGLQAVLHPIDAYRGLLLPPLAFEKLPTSVPRGMPLTVRIDASGRQTIVVSRRAAGESYGDTTLTLDADANGVVSLALGPVRAPITLRVSDGRAPHIEATVQVADRGWIGDVSLYAQYPAYLQRANETLEPVSPILVPRGTRVKVSANLRGGARNAWLTNGKDSVKFDGDSAVVAQLTLDRDSKWVWSAQNADKSGQPTLPTEVPDAMGFVVTPDRAPDIVIRAPVSDTTIASRGVVPIIVQASDDHGVGNVTLQLWRESVSATPAENATNKTKRERIDVAEPASPVFFGGATVSLDGRDLQPGDKLHVVAIATDDSPWRQKSVSAEIVLRVPGLSEQRSQARALADSLAARAAQMAQQEKRLQQNTEDASRSRDLKAGGKDNSSNGAKSPPGKDGKMSFAAAEKAKQLGKDQQQLAAKVDSLRASAKDLEDRLKSANALDTALASRMRDVQKMLRDAMTPEMQKQLQNLEKSADQLSGTQAQQSMEQLAAQQQQMRQQLEKSAEMLKRAALEGAMSTLRDDARDLAKAEQQLADRLDAKRNGQSQAGTEKSTDGKKPGQQNAPQKGQQASQQDAMASDSKALAERSRELEKEIEQLSKRLEQDGAKPGASKTKAAQPLVNQASDAMKRAAEEMADDAAKESGKQNGGKPDEKGADKNGQKGGADALEKAMNAQKEMNQQGGKTGEKGDQKQPGGASAQAGKGGEQQQGSKGDGSKDGPPSPNEKGQSRDGQQGQRGGEQKGGEQKGGEQGGGGGGGGEARKASEAMDKAAKQLASAREAQVDAWKTDLNQQLDQSINETMQLARQQAELEQKARQQGGTQGMQGEQNALQQGVQQAAERLEKAGRSSSLLSQRSQKAMADAQRRVANASQQMGNPQAGGSEASQNAMKDASEALNQALSSLVRDREKVNNAQSASGFTEMMEQLKQLAQQQGALNGQMQGLNAMPGGAKGDAARSQARALARQQREVAKTLADVSDADATGRTDALAKEAQTIAQQMERTGIDPAVAARQQQLYRRLLDAGRFLEQDERDDQGPREAKAANGNGSKGSVDGPQSGKAGAKFVPPTWNDLRGLGPDERRLVIEYFRRLNGSTP